MARSRQSTKTKRSKRRKKSAQPISKVGAHAKVQSAQAVLLFPESASSDAPLETSALVEVNPPVEGTPPAEASPPPETSPPPLKVTPPLGGAPPIGKVFPVEEVPVEEAPPVKETPVEETPPVKETPVEEPRVEEPPAVEETPPAKETPAEEPPAAEETPPAKEVPVEEPPAAEETPPVKETPVEEPPAAEETPPVKETPPVEKTAPVEPAGPFRFFSPTSFWNQPLSAEAPLDPSSASVVSALDAEELAEVGSKHAPEVNTASWSVPIYTVPLDQPTVTVTLVYHVSAGLQAAWAAVPLPPDALPAAGTDKHLVVWQPSTDRMWEFWHLEKSGTSWRASWGGAMQHVSANNGVYGPEAWPGATTSWGASASSLPLAGGLITMEDLQKGEINHAVALSVPNVRGGVFASPAQRTDGESSDAFALPEGAHLRLDPTLDLASLHLPRFTLLLATAAQRYGIFIRDKASNLAFYAEDPTPTGTNPYTGTHGYFEGHSPSSLVMSFPWSHLQLLHMELHAGH